MIIFLLPYYGIIYTRQGIFFDLSPHLYNAIDMDILYTLRRKKIHVFPLTRLTLCQRPDPGLFISKKKIKKLQRPTIRNFQLCDFSLEVCRNCHVGPRRLTRQYHPSSRSFLQEGVIPKL